MSNNMLLPKKKSVIFNFLNDKVIVSESKVVYNAIHVKFKKLTDDAMDKFLDIYYEKNKNMDDVSKNALEQGKSIIYENLSAIVNEIVNAGLFGINEKIFFDRFYSKYYDYEEYYNTINDKYLKIVLTEQEQEEYNRKKTENRSRWEGGGFGLSGALKGAMTAGALNAAGGILHGFGEMIANASARAEANTRKESMYKDKNTLFTLMDGLESSLYGIELAYIDFLNTNLDAKIQVITSESEEEAETILENIKTRSLDQETEILLLKQIIDLNPYDYSVFGYIIKKYGDRNRELEKIAGFFGCNLLNKKKHLIKKWFEKKDLSEENDVINAKKHLIGLIDKLGIDEDACKELEIIQNKLIEIDEKERTVDGILFDTREEAKAVQNDLSNLKRIYDSAKREEIGSLLNTKVILREENIEKKLKNKYIELIEKDIQNLIDVTIEKQYNIIAFKNEISQSNISDGEKKEYLTEIDKKIDISERTVNGTIYSSKEEAEKERELLIKEEMNKAIARERQEKEERYVGIGCGIVIIVIILGFILFKFGANILEFISDVFLY